MRILVHDYAGHPFQVQLSRALAARGYEVRHLYCGSTHTPRGRLERTGSDPETLEIRSIALSETIAKYSFVKRRRQEIRYGKFLADAVDDFGPDVVISANTPLDAQLRLQRLCRTRGVGFVFWLQDSFGRGVRRVLRQKLPFVGAPVAWYYQWLESRMLRASDGVVLITDDFLPLTGADDGLSSDRVRVIPNWAPLEEVPVRPKDNAWARAHGLADKMCFLYSGTLGLKHNPDLLLQLALRFRGDPNVRVVVISEGAGADWLADRRDEFVLDNLLLLPFQPFERLPQVLGAADVLTAVLEPDAGVYSVPSKVLTYLCASRPLLLAMPRENLAARIVTECGAGIVVSPHDPEAWIEQAVRLASEPGTRRRLGASARAYAERTFYIEAITDQFEEILGAAARLESPGVLSGLSDEDRLPISRG